MALDVNGEVASDTRYTMGQDLSNTSLTWHIDNSSSVFRLFWQPNINTAGTVVMTANSAGNVGIGVGSPLNRLHVAGTGRFGDLTNTANPTTPISPGVRIGSGLSENSGVEFFTSAFGAGYGWLVNAPDRGNNNAPLVFKYRNGSGSWTELVTMRSDNANVGIGTAAPVNRLDVAGNVRVEGAGNGVKFPDGTVQTKAATTGQEFGFCVSNAATAPSCGCAQVLSLRSINGGASCSTSVSGGGCNATSTGGVGGQTFGVCCTCKQ
jgi:hypothetical protein